MRSESTSAARDSFTDAAAGSATDNSTDSWVDAVVMLLATVVFGLGWVLVELERADPPLNRYDAAASEMWGGSVAASREERGQTRSIEVVATDWLGGGEAQWTDRAPLRSNR